MVLLQNLKKGKKKREKDSKNQNPPKTTIIESEVAQPPLPPGSSPVFFYLATEFGPFFKLKKTKVKQRARRMIVKIESII